MKTVKIIIIFDYFIKDNFFYKKEKENVKKKKNNLSFRIVDKKKEKTKRFNINENCRCFFFEKELLIRKMKK